MFKSSLIRNIPFGALLLLAALIAGCGSGLSGTYSTSHGAISVKFESHSAYFTTPAGTIETEYEVDGDKVILKSQMGNFVLTRNKDGSLEGPMGTLRKTGS
ncbi:MAG: hypothetical protein ACRESE_01930 [Gammaproteobacteria bacterium]